LRIRHQYRSVAIAVGPMGLGWPVAIAVVRLPRERARLVQRYNVLVQQILGQIDICGWNRSYPIGDWLLTR
jgi:hypothetical protein